MIKKTARSLFMDYLYDELEEKQRHEFEAFLSEHPDMKEELEELRNTRSMIQNTPLEEPARHFIVVEPEGHTSSEWFREAKRVLKPQSAYFRSVLAFAAILLITFIFASFSRMQITATEAGWTVHFGTEPAIIQQGINEETLNEMMSIVRQENLLLVSTLIEEYQFQNEVQLMEAVSAILDYMEEQRRHDLQLIGRGLAEIEEENYYRFIHTNETLGELLHNIHRQQ